MFVYKKVKILKTGCKEKLEKQNGSKRRTTNGDEAKQPKGRKLKDSRGYTKVFNIFIIINIFAPILYEINTVMYNCYRFLLLCSLIKTHICYTRSL